MVVARSDGGGGRSSWRSNSGQSSPKIPDGSRTASPPKYIGKPRMTATKPASTQYRAATGISGGSLGNTPLPKPAPRNTGTGGGGGTNYRQYPGTSVPPVANIEPAPMPTVNPDVDYLQEAGFLAQVSALDKALQEFESQDVAERGRYDVDFKRGLSDLGYRDENIDDDIAGQWDWNDILTASGRGYQQNTNDFASRGMLQSQGYYDSLKNLERSLEDQRGAMNTSRQNFRKGRDEGLTNYKNQDVASRDAARIAAIERLSSSLGIV